MEILRQRLQCVEGKEEDEWKCCVKDCTALTSQSYYRFPLQSEELTKVWKKCLDVKRVTRCTRVCSNHFVETDYDTSSLIKFLKPEAVPSRNLPSHRLATLNKLSAVFFSYNELQPQGHQILVARAEGPPQTTPSLPRSFDAFHIHNAELFLDTIIKTGIHVLALSIYQNNPLANITLIMTLINIILGYYMFIEI